MATVTLRSDWKIEMEKLKPLSEVYNPDVRYRGRVDLDTASGTVSETTIGSFYSAIEPLVLNENVPDEVQSHFETAKNLALYAWFVYSFNVVAAMQGFASLEMSLRMKLNDKKTPFKKLIDQAFQNRKLNSGLGPPAPLSIVLSRMRNDLAHGSTTMHGQGIAVLQTCAELINELFV